jgi:hypothetical protein
MKPLRRWHSLNLTQIEQKQKLRELRYQTVGKPKVCRILEWQYPFFPLEGLTKSDMLFELREFIFLLAESSPKHVEELLTELRDAD